MHHSVPVDVLLSRIVFELPAINPCLTKAILVESEVIVSPVIPTTDEGLSIGKLDAVHLLPERELLDNVLPLTDISQTPPSFRAIARAILR